jgi:hypothetical protein
MGKVAYITRCILMDNLHIPSSGSTGPPRTRLLSVYQRSERCSVESDSFEDLQLHDFVEANKRWADVG